MKKSSHLLVTLTLIGAVGGAIALWAGGLIPVPHAETKPPVAAGPPSPTVAVARVSEQSITEWDEFSGRIKPVDSVQIRPQVSGILEEVHFKDGQVVQKGDILFTIDPRPFEAELARANAVLASAQAHFAWARTNHERNKQLLNSHAIAQSDFDNTNDAVLEADANVKAAEAAVQTAQLNLNYTSITAPVTGRVSRAEITVGNLVSDGSNAPVLTTLVSVSPVYVEYEMDEQTFLKYAANGASGNDGMEKIPVSAGLANEIGYPHQGRLHALDNQLDTTSGTIRVRAIFDNPDGELTPGLYVKVRSGGSAPENAILVDDRAIGTDQDKKYVMVLDEGNKATYRAVVLGPMFNGLRVVRSGLQQGERIIVDGLQRVQPNAVVKPTEVAMDRNVPKSEDVSVSAK